LIVLFLIVAALSFILKRQSISNMAWLAGEFDRIKLTCSKFDIRGQTVEQIYSNIQRFEENVSRKELERETIRQKRSHAESVFHLLDDKIKQSTNRITEAAAKFSWGKKDPEEYLAHIKDFKEEHFKKSKELEIIRIEKESLGNKIKGFKEDRIPKKEIMIKRATDEIDNVRRKSGEDSLEEYITKLKSKQDCEKLIGEQRSILNSLFGQRSTTVEENILHWDEEVVGLEKYKDKATALKYDENRISELKEEEKALHENTEKLTENMGIIREEMAGVERKTNEILPLAEEHLYCQTSVDLKAVKEKLQAFLDEKEGDKDNALEVIRIFEKMEMEEKEKVSELFGQESSISKYFNGITDGFYEEVLFNQDREKIEVTRKDEVILEAEKLSGGAYDQLYLSIRLALGEKLLKGNKAFFILDDPFVKADIERLHRQVETLKNISKLGWQVLYFSAKDEIKDAMKDDMDSGAVKYIEVQSILS